MHFNRTKLPQTSPFAPIFPPFELLHKNNIEFRISKEVKPPYGSVENLFFCWEIHKITLQGQSTLVAVNANNRFMAVLSPMRQSDWTCLAGAIEITKTHGRKPVAGLNKAIDQLCRVPVKLGTRSTFQDFHCKAVNREPYHPAGYAAYGLPVEYLEQDMRKYCGAQGE